MPDVKNDLCKDCKLGGESGCKKGEERCDGLSEITASMTKGQHEGRFDNKTMTWSEPGGKRHSQRCNSRRYAENDGTTHQDHF